MSGFALRIRDGLYGRGIRAVLHTQVVMLAIAIPVAAALWIPFGEELALKSIPWICALLVIGPTVYSYLLARYGATEKAHPNPYWYGQVGWFRSLLIRSLAMRRLSDAISHFINNCNVGYSQFRSFTSHAPKTGALRADITTLWKKSEPPDFRRQGTLSYGDSSRKSRLVLVVALAMFTVLNNLTRSPRPGYTTPFRRFWFWLLGRKLGTSITDVAKFSRRLVYRRRREFCDMAIIGRILGMGRIPAAEVPAFEYCMPRRTDAFEALYEAWDLLSFPRMSLQPDIIHKSSLTAWIMLGQMTWKREVVRGSYAALFGRYAGHIVALPTLTCDKHSRSAFIRHFTPARPTEEGYCTFEAFLMSKLDEYREILRFTTSYESNRNPVSCELHTTDGLCLAVFAGLEIAATELRRRPSVISEVLLTKFDRDLWSSYEDFFEQASAFLSGNGALADTLSLKYGTFLKCIFSASGRREVQGIRWAIFRRELPRWRIMLAPSSHYIARDMDRLILRRIHENQPTHLEPRSSKLFDACVVPCATARCKANWDIALLFRSSNVAALDLIVRIIILACKHIKGASQFDRVVGVALGGVIPAAALALVLRKTLSIVYSDNVINIVPQAALAERWLLVDDVYQTGYSYQLIRSQMLGLKRMPSPNESFVLFKARKQFETQEVGSFGVGDVMEDVQSRIGCAVTYEYGTSPEMPTSSERAVSSRYPVLVEDRTGDLDPDSVAGVTRIIRQRIAAVSSRVRAQGSEAILRGASRIVARRDFLKIEMLFDHPDEVLAIGVILHNKLKGTENVAYVAGSPKAIPFLVAANLAAMGDAETVELPIIVSAFGGELRYGETLLYTAKARKNTKLFYFDVSFRSGATLRSAEAQIDELSKEGATPFVWTRKLVLASVRERAKIPDSIEILFPEISGRSS